MSLLSVGCDCWWVLYAGGGGEVAIGGDYVPGTVYIRSRHKYDMFFYVGEI